MRSKKIIISSIACLTVSSLAFAAPKGRQGEGTILGTSVNTPTPTPTVTETVPPLTPTPTGTATPTLNGGQGTGTATPTPTCTVTPSNTPTGTGGAQIGTPTITPTSTPTGSQTPVQNADCDVSPQLNTLWPPNHKFKLVSFVDGEGTVVPVTVTSVTQDEAPLARGSGRFCPDAIVSEDGAVAVRAERAGTKPKDGRVYRIGFTVLGTHQRPVSRGE